MVQLGRAGTNGAMNAASRAAVTALSLLVLASSARAETELDATEFCRRAAKNQAIFELFPDKAMAEAGSAAGAVTCRWTFTGRSDVTVTLESKLLASPMAARQTILMARLPENHRGKTVEPLPKMGDDGLSRSTNEQGALRLYEIEAVKGRRHFLMTLRPNDGAPLNYRVTDASVSFLGVGIRELDKP